MNRNMLGKLGEAKVLTKFVELGMNIYLPYDNMDAVDIVIGFNNKLFKIQVKSSNVYRNGCAIFDLKHNMKNSRIYTDGMIDYFALYSLQLDEIYMIHVNDTPNTQISIRNIDIDKERLYTTKRSDDYLLENVIEQMINL